MTEEIIEPVIEQIVEAELPVLVYKYQPKDEEGRDIGGAQVIKYRTTEELTDKLVEQSTLLIRKLRQETRKNRLGVSEDVTLAPEVKKFRGPVEFTPRELTNDERNQIARDLLEPDRSLDAQSRLIEATIGARPEVIGSTLRELQEEIYNNRAKAEAEAFSAANPDYVVCKENSEAIINWIVRYDLAPIQENFQLAFNTLKEANILILKTAVEFPEDDPVPPQVPKPEVREEVFEPSGIPSGLTREESGDSSPATPIIGDEIVYEVSRNGKLVRLTGLDAVNAMPGEEYGRRLRRDPNFGRLIEKLEAQRLASRSGQR